MPGDIFTLNEYVGKTIESWTSQYFDVREYWKITFTDGTVLHVVSDSDFSDIRTDMRIMTEEEVEEFMYEYFYEEEE